MRKTIGVACALFAAGTLSADTITEPACTPGSFSDYEGLTAGCSTGPLQFTGFALFLLDGAGGLTAPSGAFLSSITVSTDWIPASNLVSLTIGGFTPYTVGPADTAGYEIRFTVDPPPVVGAENIELDPPFGNVTGSQLFCADGLFMTSTTCSGATGPGSASFAIGAPAYIPFVPRLHTLDTRTQIVLNPGMDTASGFDGIIFTYEVTPVPEPGTWSVLALGLAALAAHRMRKPR